MSAPVKKNDDISLEITGLTSEGSGVGRYEGYAVFVPGAIPGETVNAHIIKAGSSYAVGKLCGVAAPSPERVVPPCPAFPRCGGCTLQHLDYSAQLKIKRETVLGALERIGGFSGVEVLPTVPCAEPLRCRNKGSFPFGSVDGKVVWGLYSPRSHRLIPLSDCLIESHAAVDAANAVCEWATRYSVPVYDERTGKGVLRHVVTRECTGGTAVCVVTTGKLPKDRELVAIIKNAVPNVVSLVHNVNTDSTNVICGKDFRVIDGDKRVMHELCSLRFLVSAESFLQVNTKQTEKLYSLAVGALELNGSERIADIFCGIGTISLMIAKKAASVLGIEFVERAVEDARRNAELNGIGNAEFLAGAAEEILPRLVAQGERFDGILLDPPRKGADKAVLDAIAQSGAGRIVYVSCDPATLARDLKTLCGYGYSIRSVRPVDMFPMTGHVESVVLMTKE